MEGRYGLSAAALKYLAALCMLVDHMGVVFPSMASDMGLPADLDLLPRLIGRLAFPIFLYFLAEGCRRTRFFTRYLLRLGVFALLSQVPFTLVSGVWGGSILLTFFLSAAAIWAFEQLRAKEYTPAVSCLPLLCGCLLAQLLNCDYGFPAVLLVFSLYSCGENRRALLLRLGIGLALFYLLYLPLMGILSLPLLTQGLLTEYLFSVFPLQALFWLFSEIALLPLAFYRGQLGLQPRWFFYVFYPAHLLGLWALSMAL